MTPAPVSPSPRRIPFGDLARQYAALRGPVQAAVSSVLERGWFILGQGVTAFETAFASYCGARHAVGVASGTDALQLALLACGVGPGHDVITAANTAIPTIGAIVNTGARPVLVDVRPDSHLIDPAAIEAGITSRTRAIVPVHLYGQAADMDPIVELARRHGLHVVEDAAQAHGSRYRGRSVGTLGDAGCFSFYPSKNLGAYGDAGMVVTSDPELARRVSRLRNHGQADRYQHVVHGFNSRLDELQASILSVKLPHLDAWNTRRRQLAHRYREQLADCPVTVPAEMSYGEHVYHLFVVRTPRRDHLRARLASRGIETLIHYPVPAHLQAAYRDLGAGPGSFPVTERLAGEIVSLPMFAELLEEEVDAVTHEIRRCLLE